jgi:hypothetical protein
MYQPRRVSIYLKAPLKINFKSYLLFGPMFKVHQLMQQPTGMHTSLSAQNMGAFVGEGIPDVREKARN